MDKLISLKYFYTFILLPHVSLRQYVYECKTSIFLIIVITPIIISKIVTKSTLNEISRPCILMRTAFLKCVIVFIFWPYLLHQEVNDCTLLKVNDWVTSHFLYFFTNIVTPSDKKLMPPWSLYKSTFVYWRINCLWYFRNLHPLQ